MFNVVFKNSENLESQRPNVKGMYGQVKLCYVNRREYVKVIKNCVYEKKKHVYEVLVMTQETTLRFSVGTARSVLHRITSDTAPLPAALPKGHGQRFPVCLYCVFLFPTPA